MLVVISVEGAASSSGLYSFLNLDLRLFYLFDSGFAMLFEYLPVFVLLPFQPFERGKWK